MTFSRDNKYNSNTAQKQSCPLDVGSSNAPKFVTVWDPEYGMVTYRGAKLFDPRSSADAITPQKTQMQPIDSLADNCRTSEFAVYQDVFKDTFQTTLKPSQRFHHKHSHTIASSTLGGLDLYTRDSVLVADHKSVGQIRHFSCLDQLDDDLAFDARLAFSLEDSLVAERDTTRDEGFFEVEQGKGTMFHLQSRFSTTTTSTSNYIEVAGFIREVEAANMESATWSTLEVPSTLNNAPRRRLRKHRPSQSGSPIAAPTSPSPSPSERAKYTDLVHRLPSLPKFKKESSLDEQWVCIDVTQIVTQRLV